MSVKNFYDAIIIGSGPNGLSAAITLAQKGLSVCIFEARETIGGGMRSSELTLQGFNHDTCSTILPVALASPFFSSLPLEFQWIQPSAPFAHPLDDEAILLERSIDETLKYLADDRNAYKKLMQPFVDNWSNLCSDMLSPLRIPKNLIPMIKFGLLGIRSSDSLMKSTFKSKQAKALFAGLTAHSFLSFDMLMSSAIALVLGIIGHAVGWPMIKGGTQNFANALADCFKSLGGQIITNTTIQDIKELPTSKVILCDVTPKQLLHIVKDFPEHYIKQMQKYRYGPGVFKLDWALSNPIPWKSNNCTQAGTIHIGGTYEEIAIAEKEVWENKHPENPFVLLAQPTLFDPTRAPPGKHIAWAYCHVPNGSTFDMTVRIENQIERYAPGFKDCILARKSMNTADLENYNSNYVGGDIIGGVQDIFQFYMRPVARLCPYSTPIKGLYICSASTPPGGAVHGMCGFHAAQAALKFLNR